MLYLFAGAKRPTGVAPTLRRFSQQFAKGFTVTIEEWDICRGADQDLLSSEVQESLLRRIEAGAKDLLGVDTATGGDAVVKFAQLFLAWQSAAKR